MTDQFCPQVKDRVPASKCNMCNKDVVGRAGYCCKYIDCLNTCDYKHKESCTGYKEAMALRNLTEAAKKAKKN